MSNWREQLGGEEETEALVDWLLNYYHYPVLLVFVAFAFWNRARNYSNFIVDGEILYRGNDPWYHMRSTEYIIENPPQTMPYDPWTNFPQGTFAGQFGTLFDQLIAASALLVGLGDPSQYTGRFVLLLAPAVFGVLVCVPAYFIGKRVGGRFGGIVGVLFVALAPDRLLQVSLAGNTQHHAAEVLFLGLAVLGFMIALRAAETELPVYELLRGRQFGELRATLGWSMVAGVALGLYIWVWPPGVWMFGIIGMFFLVHMMAEHLRGRSPEHTAFVGVIAFATAGLMQLSLLRTLGFNATDRSLLQPGLGLAAALGVFVLAWLSREVHSRDLARSSYPATVVGTLVAGLVLMAVLLPGVFSFFFDEFDRVFGATIDWTDSLVWFADIGTEEGAAATIGEGTPAELDDLVDFYQFSLFTAVLGGLVLVGRQIFTDKPRGEELLLVVLSVFLVIATFTQIRFAYYLTLVVGGLNAAFAGFVVRLVGTPDRQSLPEFNQVLAVVAILFVLFVPLLGLPFVGGGETAAGLADDGSQPGNVVGWSDSLDWMAEQTPAPGQYANPDGEPMEYYGQFDRTDDFDYPDGAYGVLSWWDYGHWITAKGERIANANPFQQNADPAAEFLLAQDESEATDILDEDFRDQENAGTQYVMVDALMAETETVAGGKFFAPADFHPEFERGDFYRVMVDDNRVAGIAHKQAYYESMMTRLYHFHGSEAEPDPVVTQWAGQETRTDNGDALVDALEADGDQAIVEFFDDISAARDATAEDPASQVGGIGANPAETVPALEQFRLVYQGEVPAVAGTGGNDRALVDAIEEQGLSAGPNAVTQRDAGLYQQGIDRSLVNSVGEPTFETGADSPLSVTSLDYPETVSPGPLGTLDIEYTVENTGDEEHATPVELTVSEDVVDSETITVASGGTESGTLTITDLGAFESELLEFTVDLTEFDSTATGETAVLGAPVGGVEALDRLFDTTPSFTKTFEQVPGAVIEGAVPENAAEFGLEDAAPGDEVALSVPIDPQNGESFTYDQTVQLDESLSFEATVPYSTVGYDEWGPEEGYTNVSAQATGPYQVQFEDATGEVAFETNVNVTEGQVIGEEDPTVTVEFETDEEGDDADDEDSGTDEEGDGGDSVGSGSVVGTDGSSTVRHPTP